MQSSFFPSMKKRHKVVHYLTTDFKFGIARAIVCFGRQRLREYPVPQIGEQLVTKFNDGRNINPDRIIIAPMAVISAVMMTFDGDGDNAARKNKPNTKNPNDLYFFQR